MQNLIMYNYNFSLYNDKFWLLVLFTQTQCRLIKVSIVGRWCICHCTSVIYILGHVTVFVCLSLFINAGVLLFEIPKPWEGVGGAGWRSASPDQAGREQRAQTAFPRHLPCHRKPLDVYRKWADKRLMLTSLAMNDKQSSRHCLQVSNPGVFINSLEITTTALS